MFKVTHNLAKKNQLFMQFPKKKNGDLVVMRETYMYVHGGHFVSRFPTIFVHKICFTESSLCLYLSSPPCDDVVLINVYKFGFGN